MSIVQSSQIAAADINTTPVTTNISNLRQLLGKFHSGAVPEIIDYNAAVGDEMSGNPIDNHSDGLRTAISDINSKLNSGQIDTYFFAFNENAYTLGNNSYRKTSACFRYELFI